MGNYRVVINAVGGHGQDRDAGNGDIVDFQAGGDNSPEAIVLRCVEELKSKGNSVTEATVHHWPGTAAEVLDNLLTGHRKGDF